tara:strand:- start:1162 stop:1605 length:444 start_codon:yes stop_codon:yes gene_type:complete
MIEAIHFIRKAIITRLTNAITSNAANVPVYNRVPNDASEPYIRVYSVDSTEVDQNSDTFMLECATRIEVVTSFIGDDGGELQANQIASDILTLIRTRSGNYFDLSSDGFNVYTCTNEGTSYLYEDGVEKTYFRANLSISNRVEQPTI